MFSSVLATVALATAAFAQGDLFINTPVGVTQCSVTQLSFGGGTPPYTIDAIPFQQTTAAPITVIAVTSNSPFAWTVNIASTQVFNLRIRDSQGAINYSNMVQAADNGNTGCIGQNTGGTTVGGSATGSPSGSSSTGGSSVSATGSTTPTGSSQSTASTSTTGPSSPSGSNTSSRTNTQSSSTTTPGGSQQSGSNAAGSLKTSHGLAGVFGLLGLAILA